jgi:hypothetical protein
MSFDKLINYILLAIFIVLFIASISLTWYRYVVREDFRYFLTEEETPDRFDLSTY